LLKKRQFLFQKMTIFGRPNSKLILGKLKKEATKKLEINRMQLLLVACWPLSLLH